MTKSPREKKPSVDIHEVAARLFVRRLDGSKTPKHVAEQAYKDAAFFIEESKKH